MKVIITARHCEVPDEIRERAHDMVERVAKKMHRPHRAEVIFDDDHNCRIVELQFYAPRGQTHVSRAEASDFRTALDRASDKLHNQLDKRTNRPTRNTAVG